MSPETVNQASGHSAWWDSNRQSKQTVCFVWWVWVERTVGEGWWGGVVAYIRIKKTGRLLYIDITENCCRTNGNVITSHSLLSVHTHTVFSYSYIHNEAVPIHMFPSLSLVTHQSIWDSDWNVSTQWHLPILLTGPMLKSKQRDK